MDKKIRFLQDIPQDQRTQRHVMQIEYYALAIKCVEIAEMASSAMSQGEPIHVTAAKLGDPTAFHAMLARAYFLSQVCWPKGLSLLSSGSCSACMYRGGGWSRWWLSVQINK